MMVSACADSWRAVGRDGCVRGEANTASSVTRTGESFECTSSGIVTLAETSSHHQSQCVAGGAGAGRAASPSAKAPHVSQCHQSHHASKSSHHAPPSREVAHVATRGLRGAGERARGEHAGRVCEGEAERARTRRQTRSPPTRRRRAL